MKWLALLLLLAGCAPAAKLSTPSGRPEVMIEGISTQTILNDIATWSTRNGYEIGVRTDTSISTFTEKVILVDSWETKNQPTKETYVVPTVHLYTVRRTGEVATIYVSQFQTKKRESLGIYTGETTTVTKELTSFADLERMQANLAEIGQFIRLRKL